MYSWTLASSQGIEHLRINDIRVYAWKRKPSKATTQDPDSKQPRHKRAECSPHASFVSTKESITRILSRVTVRTGIVDYVYFFGPGIYHPMGTITR